MGKGIWTWLVAGLVAGTLGCDTPLLQSVDVIEPANDGGDACAPEPAATLIGEASLAAVTLNWAVPDVTADGTIIERRSDDGGWSEIVRLGRGATTFNDGAVNLDTSYEYRAITYRFNGAEICDALPVLIDAPVLTFPNAVQSPAAAALRDDAVRLSWININATQTGVRVERTSDGLSFNEITVTDAEATTYENIGLDPEASYVYRLTALNDAGASSPVSVGVSTIGGPILQWTGAPVFGPQCTLELSGSVSYDSTDGASFADSGGSVDRASNEIMSSETGISIPLTDASDGAVSVSWEVEDTNGSTTTLTRSLTLSRTQEILSPARRPTRTLGDDSHDGAQGLHTPCGENCQGARTRLAGGLFNYCSITDDDTLRCWGTNGNGQLGQGLAYSLYDPVPACGDFDCQTTMQPDDLSLGYDHGCGIWDGTTYCWGRDFTPEKLGGGDRDSLPAPREVCMTGTRPDGDCVPATDFVQVSAGFTSSCAIETLTGTVYCWGDGSYGEVITGSDLASLNPTPVCISGSTANGDCVPLTGASLVRNSRGSNTGYTNCAIVSGEVWCWGANFDGALGGGTQGGDGFYPQPVCNTGVDYDPTNGTCGPTDDRLTNIVDLEIVGHTVCAITDTGVALCWGDNYYYELADGSTFSSRATPGELCISGTFDGTSCTGQRLDDVARISGHSSGFTAGHFCALRNDGTVWCWGDLVDGSGGLGPSLEDYNAPNVTPVCASGEFDETTWTCLDNGERSELTGVADLAMATSAVCAVMEADGSVLCWGDNSDYALARGRRPDDVLYYEDFTTLPRPACRSVDAGGLCDAITGQVSVQAASQGFCVVDNNGLASCWGGSPNDSGCTACFTAAAADFQQLSPKRYCATGRPSDCQAPEVKAIAMGLNHTCWLDSAGQPFCLGNNSEGQRGNGESRNRDTRIDASPVCIDGAWNGRECYTGDTTPPGPVLTGLVSIDANADVPFSLAAVGHTCGVHESGEVYCWGDNRQEQLGFRGATRSPVARRVECFNTETPGCEGGGRYITGMLAVDTGFRHTCALHESGEVVCWGDNERGQLGNGTSLEVVGPTRALLDQPAVQVRAGGLHTCAILEDSSVHCWGDNEVAQLGQGIFENPPPTVSRPEPVCESGQRTSCAPLTDIATISAGTYHTCAVKVTGELSCWGNNGFSQLGNGHSGRASGIGVDGPIVAYGPSWRPNPVSPCALDLPAGEIEDYQCSDAYVCPEDTSERFVAVRAGALTTCAVTTTGLIHCWGEQDRGELGNGIGDTFFDAVDSPRCTPTLVCDTGTGICANSTPFTGSSVQTCDVVTVADAP